MSRVRNIIQIIITYFLWTTLIDNSQKVIFGYDRARILTYVFMLIIVRSLVLSARAMDISNDISDGNLSNYLVKPMNYFRYWVTRDLSSKVLNLFFAVGEFSILFLLFKPEFYLQNNVYTVLSFIIAITIALAIYFCILFIISSVPFWAPELGWASQFLVIVVIIEFLSGAVFPIDILPATFQNILMLTPFPYILFFPIQVYLGKITGIHLLYDFSIAFVWFIILWLLLKQVWSRGLKEYQAFGR